MNRLLKTVERYVLRYFHVFNEALSLVSIEASGIKIDFEAEAINHSDWRWGVCVLLIHAFDLRELNVVSILELVSLVFMDSDHCWVGLSDIS